MLKERLVTAAVLILIFVLALLVGGWLLLALALAASVLCSYEFFSFAMKIAKPQVQQYTLCCALLSLGYLAYGWAGIGASAVFAVLLVFALQIISVEEASHQPLFEQTLPTAFLGLAYTGVLGAVLVAAADLQGANLSITCVVSVVVFSDTGAYFGGRKFGKHKLSPRISPNKTLEGAVCGLLASLLAAVFAVLLLQLGANLFISAMFGVLSGFLSHIVDLVGSLF